MDESNSLSGRGLLPPVVLLAAIVLMVMLHVLIPVAQLVTFPWRLLGAALAVAGLALNVWADVLFKRAGTAVKPFEPSASLVLDGPFLFSRNPMYLGMVLLLTGIVVGLGSATPWIVVPFFVWQVTHRFIIVEERKLEATFGHRYLEYKAKVRRWF